MTGSKLDASFPAAATARELGFPGVEMTSWFGFFAPAKVAPEVIQRLNKAVELSLADEELRTQLRAGGFEPKPYVPSFETARFVQAEYK